MPNQHPVKRSPLVWSSHQFDQGDPVNPSAERAGRGVTYPRPFRSPFYGRNSEQVERRYCLPFGHHRLAVPALNSRKGYRILLPQTNRRAVQRKPQELEWQHQAPASEKGVACTERTPNLLTCHKGIANSWSSAKHVLCRSEIRISLRKIPRVTNSASGVATDRRRTEKGCVSILGAPEVSDGPG